jgi:microcystin-dependent protein
MSRTLTPNLGLPYYTPDDQPDGAAQQQDLAQTLDAAIGSGGVAPVGAMFMWPGGNAPTGFLLMQGQQVDAATYPGLATLLGSAGGLVTIPDMRDRFPVGAGGTYPVITSVGGAATVQLTDRQSGVRAHNHGGITAPRDRSQNHGHPPTDAGGYFQLYSAAGGVVAYNGTGEARPGVTQTGAVDPADHLHGIATEAAQWALDAHENRPPFRALNFIIRAL